MVTLPDFIPLSGMYAAILLRDILLRPSPFHLPATHSAFTCPYTLLQFAKKLRTLSGGKPVGIKLCVGKPEEITAIVRAMKETGETLDFITVDGKVHFV